MHIDIKVVKSMLQLWIDEHLELSKNGEIPPANREEESRMMARARKAIDILNGKNDLQAERNAMPDRRQDRPGFSKRQNDHPDAPDARN